MSVAFQKLSAQEYTPEAEAPPAEPMIPSMVVTLALLVLIVCSGASGYALGRIIATETASATTFIQPVPQTPNYFAIPALSFQAVRSSPHRA